MYPSYVHTVLKEAAEIIGALRARPGEVGYRSAVERLKAAVCADYFVMGLPTRAKAFAYCDFPPEWQREYGALDMWGVDPIVRYQMSSNGACQYWFRALRCYPVSEYASLMAMSLDVGLRFGLCNSVHDAQSGHVAVVSVSATHNHFREHHKLLLDIVTPHLYLALYPRERRGDILSPREQEVLRWVTRGKTNWEISRILRISENTVRFHLKNINSKLNTTNKYHAVAIAMAQGLLN